MNPILTPKLLEMIGTPGNPGSAIMAPREYAPAPRPVASSPAFSAGLPGMFPSAFPGNPASGSGIPGYSTGEGGSHFSTFGGGQGQPAGGFSLPDFGGILGGNVEGGANISGEFSPFESGGGLFTGGFGGALSGGLKGASVGSFLGPAGTLAGGVLGAIGGASSSRDGDSGGSFGGFGGSIGDAIGGLFGGGSDSRSSGSFNGII